MGFSQCTICSKLALWLTKTSDVKTREVLCAWQSSHLEMIRNSRHLVCGLEFLSQMYPEEIWMEMADRMNAQTTTIPRVQRFVK